MMKGNSLYWERHTEFSTRLEAARWRCSAGNWTMTCCRQRLTPPGEDAGIRPEIRDFNNWANEKLIGFDQWSPCYFLLVENGSGAAHHRFR